MEAGSQSMASFLTRLQYHMRPKEKQTRSDIF
jgi:hypothetical protein